MVCKVLSIVSLISIILIVNGSQMMHKPHYAVPLQSYQRDNVPVSYKFSAIHSYPISTDTKTIKQQNVEKMVNERISRFRFHPLRYAEIQYAPLPHSKKKKHGDSDYHTTPHDLNEISRHIHSTEATPKNSHLEPHLVANNLEEHKQDYRSFEPEYKIEVPSTINQNVGLDNNYKMEVNSTRNQHMGSENNFVSSQANDQDYQQMSYYKNPDQNHYGTPPSFIFESGEQTSENHIQGDFLPLTSTLLRRRSKLKLKSLHQQLLMEKPVQAYQHVPRLHLNIARIYSIANQPQKAPKQAASVLDKTSLLNTNLAKPPALTQAIFIPNNLDEHKTLLFPVPNHYKDSIIYV